MKAFDEKAMLDVDKGLEEFYDSWDPCRSLKYQSENLILKCSVKMPLSQEILHVLSETHGLNYFCQDHILEKLHGEPSKAVEKNDLQRRYLKLSYIYNTPGTSLDNQICHDTQVLLKLTNSITLDGLHAKLSNFQNEKLFILQSIKKSLESIILAQSSPSLQEIKDLMEMYKSAILPSLNHYVSAQEEYLMTVCLSLSEKSKLLQAQITTTTYDGGIGEKALQIRYVQSIILFSSAIP